MSPPKKIDKHVSFVKEVIGSQQKHVAYKKEKKGCQIRTIRLPFRDEAEQNVGDSSCSKGKSVQDVSGKELKKLVLQVKTGKVSSNESGKDSGVKTADVLSNQSKKDSGVKKAVVLSNQSKKGSPVRKGKSELKGKNISVCIYLDDFHEILSSLNENQIKRVKLVGFGGLLDITFKKPINDMNNWLIQSFDPVSQSFFDGDNVRFVVSANDIHDLFGLPRNEGTPLPVYSHSLVDFAEYFKIKMSLLKELGAGDCSFVFQKSLIAKIKSFDDASDDFIRFFILAAYCMILNPTTIGKVDFRIMKALKTVDTIINYDWCSHVLDKICEGVRRVKKVEMSRKVDEEPKKSVAGCFIGLQLIFFQHVTFRTATSVAALPLVKHWKGNSITERIKLERKAMRFGLGNVSILPVCNKPICKNHLMDVSNGESSSGAEHNQKSPSRHGAAERCPLSDDNSKDSHGYCDPGVEISKIVSKIGEMMSSIDKVYLPRLKDLAQELAKQDCSPSDSQFFGNPFVLEQIDVVVEQFLAARNNIHKMTVGQQCPRAATSPGENKDHVDEIINDVMEEVGRDDHLDDMNPVENVDAVRTNADDSTDAHGE